MDVLIPSCWCTDGRLVRLESQNTAEMAVGSGSILGVVLYLIAESLVFGADSMNLGAFLGVASFTGIACLAVEAVSCVIAWLARRNKKD